MNKLVKIILIISTPILQLSLFSNLPYLNHLNFILCLAILLLFFSSNFLFYLIFIAGITLDIYSILPFPLITLTLVFSILILRFLFKNLFTNRSLYSLILLGLTGIFFYNLFLTILIYLSYLLKLIDFSPILDKLFFSNLGWQFLANSLFLAIIWTLSNLSKTKLHRTFLFEK